MNGSQWFNSFGTTHYVFLGALYQNLEMIVIWNSNNKKRGVCTGLVFLRQHTLYDDRGWVRASGRNTDTDTRLDSTLTNLRISRLGIALPAFYNDDATVRIIQAFFKSAGCTCIRTVHNELDHHKKNQKPKMAVYLMVMTWIGLDGVPVV